MRIDPLTHTDLPAIRNLQPEGWPDIVPVFDFYIRSAFCDPVKVTLNGHIVGLGASIAYDTTAWLAHIIVSKNHRNKGIGYELVCEILNRLDRTMETCLLLATPSGQSVYRKAGFREVTPYLFFQREKPWRNYPVSSHIIPFEASHRKIILKSDREITGENRENILSNYIKNARIYWEDHKVKGYYIPGAGEGPIIADTVDAGLELMKMKYAKADTAVLPADNSEGIAFLEQNGFTLTHTQGIRMIRGKEIHWKPEKIYSRIGGNFG